MLNFTTPPRNVPLSLQVSNLFNGISQIGWAVFGFGMIFFWAFVSNGDYSFITFRGPFEHATGKMVSVVDTGARENRQSISACHYEYSVAGYSFSGTSYTNGSAGTQGDNVDVEYQAGHPEKSRIAGMRRAMFGPFVLFVVIFPAIGLILLVVAMRIGMKRNHVLREGVFTTGVLKDIQPTNMQVNRQTVMALTFEFTARDGQRHEVEARTTNPARLQDEAQEPLLYDPNNPTKAWVLDDAPARPAMGMNGELVGSPVRAFAFSILPALVIAANAFAVYWKFLR
jgi:hypothetical protein